MTILSNKYSSFGWENNVGYGTKEHIEKIKKLGPTDYHRKTFEPIKSILN